MLHDAVTDHFRLQETQKRALDKLKIRTVLDLLYHFPARYENSGDQTTVGGLVTGADAVLFGTIRKPQARKSWKSKRPMSEAWLEDGTGKVKLMWFNQPYIAKMLVDGSMVKVSGRVEGGASKYIANPEVERVSELPVGGTDTVFGSQTNADEFFAVYPETKGITSRWFRHAIAKILKGDTLEEIKDIIPSHVLATYKLPRIQTALLWIHQPKKNSHAEAARKRFSFEEIFIIQIAKQHLRKKLDREPTCSVERGIEHAEEFIARLPFALTEGQRRAIDAILADISSPPAMSRLLEGDVGSGKTAVAATLAYTVVKTPPKERPSANLQVAYMAPTEILAEQHFASFIEYFGHLPIQLGLITSSGCKKFPSKVDTSKATKISKNQLLKWVANGEIAMLIGTHALIQKNVQFRDLGLVIIDEQHRFGVDQRKALISRQTQTGRGMNAETDTHLLYEDLIYKIRDALFTVRKELGLGHQERIYQRALEEEFKNKHLYFSKEVHIPITYNGKKIGIYIPDFVIEDKIIIELKALTTVGSREKKQLWSYLKGSEYKLGLLVNFGKQELEIERVVYDTARNSSASIPRPSASVPHGSAYVPHLLSMTATPIPRTLALTLYGDLDLTILDEMPPGRKPIITKVVGATERTAMYRDVCSRLDEGRQAYVICPRIEEPDPQKALSVQTKAVETETARLKMKEFRNYRVAMLHGQMKPKEKEVIMQAFLAHDIDVLVATSVVEVGVNVPNATTIIIEGAERFGLAQLHQLRGRVVRSNHQAYCYALTSGGGSNKRLQAFVKAKNGFELAEQDLKIRGPGELYGRSQSGITDLGMEALKNIKMVEAARTEAQKVITDDPMLEKNQVLKDAIQARKERIHFE